MAPRDWLAGSMLMLTGACSDAPQTLPPPAPEALRVATYNVHYIVLSEQTGSWSVGDWEVRKGPLDAAFKAIDADVIAFQEMESFQRGSDGSVNLARDWLAERNPGYGVTATGDWRTFPSTQPIFYRRERLSPVDQGWFFFSETPDTIYSRTFDGGYPAFASWARFEEREGGESFRVVNIHFDYSSGSNQRKSAALVAERIAPWIRAGERVFVVGDVNDDDDSAPARTMAGAGVSFLPVEGATWHWDMGMNLTSPVDHLAHSPGIEPVAGPFVLRRKFEGEWPTDHYPVVADFVLK